MIKWNYSGLPTSVEESLSSPTTTYSKRVLVIAKFKDSKESPEAYFATLVTRLNGGDPSWIVWGLTGKVEVLAWTEITPLKP